MKSKHNATMAPLSCAAGDLSDTVSVICMTSSMTATGSSLTGLESGSDFISRGNSNSYRVLFPPGISTATCDVKVRVEAGGKETRYIAEQRIVTSVVKAHIL